MNNSAKILIVDSNKDHADSLADSLAENYKNITVLYTPRAAIENIDQTRYDVVITELQLNSELTGIDILSAVKNRYTLSSVIILTDYATIESCKEAIRKGAYEYLEKPAHIEQLKVIISQAVPTDRKSAHGSDFVFEGVLSKSKPMQALMHVIRRAAPTDLSILIEGESGTGKELLARAIHDNSNRSDRPYYPINCAGLSETLLESELFGHVKGSFTGATTDRKGLFEVADQGTLFLDEIGDMPLNMQAKLLRVLEDGLVVPVGSTNSIKVDVRIVCATNHNLARLVEEKKFRQDLYFRIKGVSITVPPLRNRPSDIEELFGFFLKQACEETGRKIRRITTPAMSMMMNYSWPGNIRQLKNVVKTMTVMCESDTLDVEDIPPEIHSVKRLNPAAEVIDAEPAIAYEGQSLNEVEKEHIKRTLEMTDGNRAEAAKKLKIGERTLYRKIKEYNL